ncbi:MAG TPA: IS630 family transposase [Gemmataceae bacterium]|jgi:transposase|nr:IS630 family transposase [Gemmataceae bacterium]
MPDIVPRFSWLVKEKMRQRFQTCKNALVRLHYLIVFNLWRGRRVREIEAVLSVHNTTIYRLAKRFCERGEAALWDGRENNGAEKLSETFLGILDQVVRSSPRDHGWRRPTWTRELLVKTMVHKTGICIHVATMSRALALIKARRGKPRPRVKCPWHPAAKTRRLNQIARLVASLPKNEMALYEDEVDVHLNPKIGLDWMGLGQQKDVMTPGQNEKRYLAGALDVRTREIHWVEATKKDAWLFLDLLKKLTVVYAHARVIHVILDNYKIHKSQIIGIALAHFARRVRLHFLPPYCPDYNRIERVWQDLHAQVTRNHQCSSMKELLGEVRYYLRKRNRRLLRQVLTASAA